MHGNFSRRIYRERSRRRSRPKSDDSYLIIARDQNLKSVCKRAFAIIECKWRTGGGCREEARFIGASSFSEVYRRGHIVDFDYEGDIR
jgi:hypothetical protein